MTDSDEALQLTRQFNLDELAREYVKLRDEMTEMFDKCVVTLHVKNDYRGENDDFVRGKKEGIDQGLRIAKSILKTFPAPIPRDRKED